MNVLVLLLLVTTTTFAQLDSRVGTIAKRYKPFGWVELKDSLTVQPSRFFIELGSQLGLGQHDEMRLLKVDSGKSERTRHRFQQYYRGLEVEGAVYIVHADNARVVRANGKIASDLAMDVQPRYTADEAYKVAKQQLPVRMHLRSIQRSQRDNDEQVESENSEATPQLLLTRRDDNAMITRNNLVLAYKFYGYQDNEFKPYAIYVDANTGVEVKRVPLFTACFQTTDCQNDPCNSVTDECTTDLYGNRDINSLYDQTESKYKLYDDCRGVGIHTKEYVGDSSVEVLSTTSSFAGILQTTQAHWAAMQTYDYFCSIHDTKLLDTSGHEIRQLVGWSAAGSSYIDKEDTTTTIRVVLTATYLNAQPYCSLQVSTDVVAHEWTHGITDYTSNLDHANGEAAALNEGFSDIFGKMVEYYVDKHDNPNAAWEKFVMFEEICLASSHARRSFSDPDASGLADVYDGAKWNGQGTTNESAQQYLKAGVLLKWFYLLAKGGTGTNCSPSCPYEYLVTPIGPDDASKIAFATLTGLSPTDGFHDAREVSVGYTIDEYGENSAEVMAVIEAWNAVGVYDEVSLDACGDFNGGPHTIQAICSLETCSPPPSFLTTIHAGANVEFKAGSVIRLKPGFRAASGSYFRASTNSCPRQFGKVGIASNSIPKTRDQVNSPEVDGGVLTMQIIPNPHTTDAMIRFSHTKPCDIDVSIVDAQGKVLRTVISRTQSPPGFHDIPLDLKGIPAGVYYCVLRTGMNVTTALMARIP